MRKRNNTNLTLEEALKIYNNLPDFKDTWIHLGEWVLDMTDDFWALYYKIDNCEGLDWMPPNPHVSFVYSYDKPVEDHQIQMVRGRLGSNRHPNRSAKLTHASVVLCDGHYSSWKKISSTNKKDGIIKSHSSTVNDVFRMKEAISGFSFPKPANLLTASP